MKRLRILDLGLVTYRAGLQVQEQAVAHLKESDEETLILLQHSPVITFGRNGGEENLPLSIQAFQSRGIDVVKTSRGGNITCHFPGQLVAYPIMRLDRQPGGVRGFFHNMEEAVIHTLKAFQLSGQRINGKPGVWVNGQKICSTGIAVSRWITRHGLSLNIGEDISLFELIRPCGLQGIRATSMHRELPQKPRLSDVKAVFAGIFSQIVGRLPAKEIK